MTTAPGRKVYFVSDVHLGSHFHADPLALERRFSRWLYSLSSDAGALYLVGDIFDYWFEYRHVVPRGHTRVLGALSYLADRGVELHFFTGNHDVWVLDYLQTEVGVILHREPAEVEIDGHLFYIAHGDEYDYRHRSFRILRAIFHNPLCRLLYAAVHPRWTVGLAHAWSLRSRKKGLRLRPSSYEGEQQEYLVRFAKEYAASAQRVPEFFVFGHRHILLDLMLSRHSRVLILGDWLRYDSYAVWDGTSMELHTLREE